MRGKLIIIEAGDGSGKATQTQMLYNRLKDEGYNVEKVEYPNYNSESSALIKMYLKGDFGKNAYDVSPYVASTFYAVDRYASYKKEWEEFYLSGGIILADRYTTSNMVHQSAKIDNEADKTKYLDWLYDFEYNIFKLPVPDCVCFLDMPPQFSKMLISERKNKFSGESTKDIHEKDYNYMVASYNNSVELAARFGWHRISCVKDNRIKSVDEIHNEIYNTIKDIL